MEDSAEGKDEESRGGADRIGFISFEWRRGANRRDCRARGSRGLARVPQTKIKFNCDLIARLGRECGVKKAWTNRGRQSQDPPHCLFRSQEQQHRCRIRYRVFSPPVAYVRWCGPLWLGQMLCVKTTRLSLMTSAMFQTFPSTGEEI